MNENFVWEQDKDEPLSLNRTQFLKALNDQWDVIAPNTPSFVLLISGGILFTDGGKRLVCPIGLLDEQDMAILEMESFCSEYSCLPYNGGIESQPAKIVQAFNVIRSVKIGYQARKTEKMTRDQKKNANRN